MQLLDEADSSTVAGRAAVEEIGGSMPGEFIIFCQIYNVQYCE
jgi:hypothetical protein